MKSEIKYYTRRVIGFILVGIVAFLIRSCMVNAAVISYPFTPTPDSVRFSDSTHTSLQNVTTYTSMSTATHGSFKVYKQTTGNGSMYARMYFQNGQFSDVNSKDRIYKVTSVFYSTYPINNVEYELSQRRYSCNVTNSYPHQWTTNGNANQTTQGTIYSIECDNVVQDGSNGYFVFQFDKVNNLNGYINLGLNNITFVWTNYINNSELTNIINNQSQQQHQDAEQQHQDMQDINNSMNNSNVDTNNSNSTISGITNSLPSSNVLGNLITMPVMLVQKIINALSSNTCTPYSLGTLFGTNFTLPCVDLSTILGAVWTILDGVVSGFIAYEIGKHFVLIFHKLTSFDSTTLEEVYK